MGEFREVVSGLWMHAHQDGTDHFCAKLEANVVCPGCGDSMLLDIPRSPVGEAFGYSVAWRMEVIKQRLGAGRGDNFVSDTVEFLVETIERAAETLNRRPPTNVCPVCGTDLWPDC